VEATRVEATRVEATRVEATRVGEWKLQSERVASAFRRKGATGAPSA
jgi:hypothetical protein